MYYKKLYLMFIILYILCSYYKIYKYIISRLFEKCFNKYLLYVSIILCKKKILYFIQKK